MPLLPLEIPSLVDIRLSYLESIDFESRFYHDAHLSHHGRFIRGTVQVRDNAAIFFTRIILLVKIQYTETPDGCLNCYVHYFRSPSCAIVGLGFGLWNYGLTDCRGPIIP